jgi:hypothetical protein
MLLSMNDGHLQMAHRTVGNRYFNSFLPAHHSFGCGALILRHDETRNGPNAGPLRANI